MTLSALIAYRRRHQTGRLDTLLTCLPFLVFGATMAGREILQYAGQYRGVRHANVALLIEFLGLPIVLGLAFLARRIARVRIRWLMILIGILAIVFAEIARPFDRVIHTVFTTSVLLFFGIASYVLFVVVPYALILAWLRCPACGRRSLRTMTLRFHPPFASLHVCRRLRLNRYETPGKLRGSDGISRQGQWTDDHTLRIISNAKYSTRPPSRTSLPVWCHGCAPCESGHCVFSECWHIMGNVDRRVGPGRSGQAAGNAVVGTCVDRNWAGPLGRRRARHAGRNDPS